MRGGARRELRREGVSFDTTKYICISTMDIYLYTSEWQDAAFNFFIFTFVQRAQREEDDRMRETQHDGQAVLSQGKGRSGGHEGCTKADLQIRL